MSYERPVTKLSRHEVDAIYYRDRDLVADLMGKSSFVDVFFHQLTGRPPAPAETRLLDAVLVTLMEHGFTPSVIAGRLVYSSSPESVQAGVAAGLLAVGSRFVGTMEGCARLLVEIAAAGPGGEDHAAQIVQQHRARREPVPGFGHHLHRPDDPRSRRLLELAEEEGMAGSCTAALHTLAQAVDASAGRHITINATGAVAAVLGDVGIDPRIMRGVAVLARAAGLVTHIAEEQLEPTDRFIWELVDGAVPFEE